VPDARPRSGKGSGNGSRIARRGFRFRFLGDFWCLARPVPKIFILQVRKNKKSLSIKNGWALPFFSGSRTISEPLLAGFEESVGLMRMISFYKRASCPCLAFA